MKQNFIEEDRPNLATVQIVDNIRAHPNADSLELVDVLGWQCVSRKDKNLKIGDKIIFIPIDTTVPGKYVSSENERERLKTVRLRGEVSQGIILNPQDEGIEISGEIGEDFTERLGVKKYIKLLPPELKGKAKGNFPTHIIPTTDEDDLCNNPKLLELLLNQQLMPTLKLDGTSMTVIFQNNELAEVCSRNLSLVETPDHTMWKIARQITPIHPELVLQGELMGPGINKNQLDLRQHVFYIFTCKVGNEFVNVHNYYSLLNASNIWPEQIKLVPSLGIRTFSSLSSMKEFVNSQTLPNGKPAEGVVFRPIIPQTDRSGRPLGGKIINENYKD